MKHAKRGSGSLRVVSVAAVAGFAVTLALAACGGGGGGGSPSSSVSPATASAWGGSGVTGGTSASGTASTASTATATTTTNTPPTMHSESITLNWMPPTQNTNGTALTDLAGYEIHYGPQSDQYTNTIKVDNPGIATYVVDNLSPGTYYFVVTAYNADGTQSPVSSEVHAVVE
jgi:hypothetical protein